MARASRPFGISTLTPAQNQLSISDVSTAEGTGAGTTTFTFTVTRTALSGASAVAWATSPGTATAGATCVGAADYQTASGTLNFAAGVATQTLSVNVCRDAIQETDETFTVTLSSPTNATIVDGTGTGTILNDDSSFTINDVSAAEGTGAGTTIFTFTVTKSGASTLTSTVAYATTPGSATGGAACAAGIDYVNASGTLTFAPATTTQTIAVTVCRDAVFEANEAFTVDLSSPTNANITDASGLGTITNDDTAPTLSIDDVSAAEGTGAGTTTFTFTVTKTGSTELPSSVNFATGGGTATAGATCTGSTDYQSNSGTLTFAANVATQTVAVTVCRDATFEANESFNVTLSAPSGATIADGTGAGTIQNDDTAPTLSIDDVEPGRRDRRGHDDVHVHRDEVGRDGAQRDGQLRDRGRDRYGRRVLHRHRRLRHRRPAR